VLKRLVQTESNQDWSPVKTIWPLSATLEIRPFSINTS